jgi:ligand-binding sensor domain-containing protein/two-component sensor histidine kinase
MTKSIFQKRYSLISFLVYFSCLFLPKLHAQVITKLPFITFDINNGLSQGYVKNIIQDKKGFLWFSTNDGLNRYDGYNFTVFHHDANDPTSLADDELTFVFEDSNERLWIATRNQGVELFDRKSQTFFHYPNVGKQSAYANEIYNITEDKTGHIWLSSALGLYRATIGSDPGNPPNQKRKKSPFVKFTSIITNSSTEMFNHKRIWIDHDGRLFIFSPEKIYQLIEKSRNSDKFHLEERYHFPKLAVGKKRNINILEDTLAHCYLLHVGQGVLMSRGYNWNSFRKIGDYPDNIENWLIDRKHRLWISTNERLIRIQFPEFAKEYIETNNRSQIPTLKNITCLLQDRTGVIWIGTNGLGMLKYQPDIELFHHSFPNQIVYWMFLGEENEVIIDQKLGQGSSVLSFHRKHLSGFKKFDRAKTLTLLKKTSTIYTYYSSLPQYTSQETKNNNDSIITTMNCDKSSPIRKDSKNTTWIAGETGLIKILPDGKIKGFPYPVPAAKELFEFVHAMIVDKGDHIWLGTAKGLLNFNPTTEKFFYYHHRSEDPVSLNFDVVYTLCNDPTDQDKYLWIGTKGGGLNRLDKSTGKFISYTTDNGLPNNVVYGILTDNDGNLWLSTNKGLSKFNPVRKTFRNFTVGDGVQSNEFNRYAYVKLTDGTLVFGGMQGINYFNPRDIKELAAPKVQITDFRLSNQALDLKDPKSPLKSDIIYSDQITFSSARNVFTIGFAAMDYRKRESVQYRYRLEGFDKDWSPAQTAHEATYTNLDPGKYRFVVEGSNTEGIWGKYETALLITITPVWYQTFLFRIIVCLIILGLIYYFYTYRLKQALQIQHMRNHIAKDLHDEIGSSLSTISIYSKVARQQLDLKKDPVELLEKISQNTQSTMEAMSDIIWSTQTNNDGLENVVSRLREHATELLEAQGYRTTFTCDTRINGMVLNMQQRRDLFLIGKEAINNIAKYAFGQCVYIALTTEKNYLKLTVQDDGQGFDMNQVAKGNGFKNMQTRATDQKGVLKIYSNVGKGTKIEATLKFV